MTLSFLLKGKVQGVKMRRYVESAGRHFGVGGYVINIDDGDPHDPGAVFGQAWVVAAVEEEPGTTDSDMPEQTSRLDAFERWIRGEWKPQVYTNIKPTPIGTAYPEKAQVEGFAVWKSQREPLHHLTEEFNEFTMVRGDDHAMIISQETAQIRRTLSSAMASGSDELDYSETIVIGSWPPRD